MFKIKFLILSIIWQYFKIKNKRQFFRNYLKSGITFIDTLISLYIIYLSIMQIYMWYMWLQTYNMQENIGGYDILVLSLISIIGIFYLTRLFFLSYKKTNMKIKKIYFWLSVVLELVFIYLI